MTRDDDGHLLDNAQAEAGVRFDGLGALGALFDPTVPGGWLVEAGLAADEEVDRHLASVESGRLDLTTAPMISAWGRRPG